MIKGSDVHQHLKIWNLWINETETETRATLFSLPIIPNKNF